MNTKVSLKSSHLYLDSSLVDLVFQKIQYAYVTYLKEKNRLLITPVSSQWFIKMYQPTQFLLKSRNIKGDKTIAIREILIDNDLDFSDRELDFEIIQKTNLIKVKMK